MKLLKALILIALFAFPLALNAQETKPLSATDLVQFNRLFDVQVSPDARYAAFTMRETDLEADKGRTDIWLLDLAAVHKGPMRLTTHQENDSSPRWGPDSKTIYFLSNRGGNSQVWMIEIGGGEAHQLTDYPVDVDLFEISRNGSALVFSALVYPQCNDFQCTATRFHIIAEDPETGLVYNELMVRVWDTWRDGRMPRLFTIALGKKGRPKNPKDVLSLMGDIKGSVPNYALEGSETFEISPDGSRVYFSTQERGPDEPWSINSDIFSARIDGLGAPENLTEDNLGSDTNPILSADGKYLAWFSTSDPKRWSEGNKIKLKDLATGEVRVLAPGWDRYPGAMVFSHDSSYILATSDHLGERVLWQVPLTGETRTLMAGGGAIGNVASTFRGTLFTRADLKSPADLFLQKGPQTFRLTQVNKDRLAGLKMGEFEQFSFTGARGETVYGYVVFPAEFDPAANYPLAMLIHGGPARSMGNGFSYRWNPQVYAGAGYGAVFIDFHGSTGYGQDFVDSIHNDRGGAPIEDVKLGLAAALEKYPWLDGERACALGGSFGGYLVNLIAGSWPDGFKCLVTHDGMFDNRMKYFTSDFIGYLDEGFGGQRYYQDMTSHEKFNPATMVDNWQTPMLVIHGEKDFRVPITQGIAAFTAAQAKGVKSKFLMFPDENHWVLKPNNSIQWHREVIFWLNRWTKE